MRAISLCSASHLPAMPAQARIRSVAPLGFRLRGNDRGRPRHQGAFQTGLRFSTKALKPSLQSSVASTAPIRLTAPATPWR